MELDPALVTCAFVFVTLGALLIVGIMSRSQNQRRQEGTRPPGTPPGPPNHPPPRPPDPPRVPRPPRPPILPGYTTTTVTRSTTVNGRQATSEEEERFHQALDLDRQVAAFDRQVAAFNRALPSTIHPFRNFGVSMQQAAQALARLSTSQTVRKEAPRRPPPPDTRKTLHAQLMEDDD